MTDAPRVAAIKAKIAAREGKPEFRESVAALKAELARITAK